MYDFRYWLWLSLIFKTGSPLCDSLLHAFNHNPKAIYEADKAALSPFCKNNDLLLSRLSDKRLNRVYSILDFCQKENIGILTPENRHFPSALLKIEGQPLVLYYKGRLPSFSRSLCVSVVGTRNVTAYGSSAAYTIAHDLASTGAIVVSGMALGADTAAHRGALDAGGHTVAFLGCGIDIIYPKDNARLMQEIISCGTVITEYAPGLPPEGRHFPVRNRLMSGVSSAILVVEASEKSGAMITASHGLKQGKLIYAVPGKVGELASTGTNLLIRNGAKMVTAAKDIISDFSGLYEFKFSQNRASEQMLKKQEQNSSVKTDFFENNGNRHSQKADNNRTAASTQTVIPDRSLISDTMQSNNTGNTPFSSDAPNTVSYNRQLGGTSQNAAFDNRQLGGTSQNTVPTENTFGYGPGANGPHNVGQYGINGNQIAYHTNTRNTFRPTAEQHQTTVIAAQPRPTILYNGMTEEEVAASYMSMETEINVKPAFFPDNIERVYLTYPKGPMPENGYEITLTEEGLKNFNKINEERFKTAFSETDRVFPVASYKADTDPIAQAVSKKAEENKRLKKKSKRDQKSAATENAVPKTKQALNLEGLNETEATVLKFIFEHQPISIDGMNALNLSVPQLLSTLTVLEIKQRISQKPGGYFEIKE